MFTNSMEEMEYLDDDELELDDSFGSFKIGRSIEKAVKRSVTEPIKATKRVNTALYKTTVRKPLSATRKLNTMLYRKTVKPVLSATRKINTALYKKTVKPVLSVTKKVNTALLRPSMAITSKLAKKSPIAAALLMPVETMALNKKAKDQARGQAPVVEQSQAQVVDGPLVNIYLPDGSESQVPSNYIVNGLYKEDGVVWSITPPKMVTVYSMYGDSAEVPGGLIKSGKYVDDQGGIWTEKPPRQVKIYSEWGDTAEIPEGMLSKSGTYRAEDGSVWTTSAPSMVMIYSEYGDKAEVPKSLLVSGKYTDEEGNVWGTTPVSAPVSQQVVESLAPSAASVSEDPIVLTRPAAEPEQAEYYPEDQMYANESPSTALVPVSSSPALQEEIMYVDENGNEVDENGNPLNVTEGGGEVMYEEEVFEEAAPSRRERQITWWDRFIAGLKAALSDNKGMSGLGEDSYFDTIAKGADSLTSLVEKGRGAEVAVRKLRKTIKRDKGSAPETTDYSPPADNKIFGLPPAVAYGGTAASVVGLGFLLYKIRKSRKG